MSSLLKRDIEKLVSQHQYARGAFKELIVLAKEVDAKCADNPDVPDNISRFMIKFWVTLEALIQKEELHIFPLILEGRISEAFMSAQEAIVIHSSLENELKEIMEKVITYKVESKSCDLWKDLVAKTRVVANKLVDHLHYEQEVFSQAIPNLAIDSFYELDQELKYY